MKQYVLKTGTTTLGLVCKDGLVLAADRRVTAGNYLANKDFDKIYKINDRMLATVAGSASDVQMLLKIIRAEANLKTYTTGRNVTVKEVANIIANLVFSNIRRYSVIPGVSQFVLGGMDDDGFHIFDIYPDGSVTEVKEYISSGSGSFMVYGVLETLYSKGMSVSDGVKLAVKALNSAIQRDTASGSGYDIYCITKEGIKQLMHKDLEIKVD